MSTPLTQKQVEAAIEASKGFLSLLTSADRNFVGSAGRFALYVTSPAVILRIYLIKIQNLGTAENRIVLDRADAAAPSNYAIASQTLQPGETLILNFTGNPLLLDGDVLGQQYLTIDIAEAGHIGVNLSAEQA